METWRSVSPGGAGLLLKDRRMYDGAEGGREKGTKGGREGTLAVRFAPASCGRMSAVPTVEAPLPPAAPTDLYRHTFRPLMTPPPPLPPGPINSSQVISSMTAGY
ncbi:hypothetical protein EYF80_037024 [Liparis tanakae]|uniref:Uncharacterized protein n=1 Tax=Liparis tanakae TaxID=230148 RepID=A0A4Z2GHW6_9TELE|nr:hypothetical protein EYF80_037024 [Liparis tanakae]